MAKIAVTPSIVLAEFVWYQKRVTFSKVIALTVVSIGVAIATVTDLQFSLFGACVAMAWIIPSAINKILWSNLQQEDNWTALSLMWKTTPITLLFLVSMIPFLDPPGVLAFHWSFNNTSAILLSAFLGFLLQWSGALHLVTLLFLASMIPFLDPPGVLAFHWSFNNTSAILLSAFLGFLLQWSGALHLVVGSFALGATSAISHVVLGQFKTCVLLLGSYYLFSSNPGTTSMCGAFTAIGGMSLFTYLNLNAKKQPAPLKVSSSLPKSKFSEGNGESRHGNGADFV
ncbi:Nucleotide/sugar transporter family protein isoform 2 [Hibiscus syriacus]|uniref:Nucleotide/sugar transporter family protein isoform 2 n=1 Tax=Hibiscus syriacus TaxID=106335 RepID=A0A6A2WH74_HIBSY|nr:Nucleotide/sugar transporter family protein isoform 2 [Hibiscus syriacus]